MSHSSVVHDREKVHDRAHQWDLPLLERLAKASHRFKETANRFIFCFAQFRTENRSHFSWNCSRSLP
ncbi:hypothetical protein MPLB_180060 [Mesorhizobium sp. ORS 3324]|nr:hypothetical protein MPLB_180060 [Mesorhizobium sp. ORS 3324]